MSEETFSIQFFQGARAITSDPLGSFKKKVRELCNVKNLNFLFGSGTSAGAVPTMIQIKTALDDALQTLDKPEVKKVYEDIDKNNLEDTLNVLYAKRYYLRGIKKSDEVNTLLPFVEELIEYIQCFMFEKINISFESESAKKVLDIYKKFYLKLALRNKDLSRINIFTTNNDLFNERALDYLHINFNNGFGGGLDKTFNPARFHYTFSKKIDLNLEKFEPLENMVYLYKLHGSVNWSETDTNSLFNIEERSLKGGETSPQNPILIYPTPMKQNQSLGSPYSDIIREFQAKLTQQNSALFIIGYSFSDEHLNNIIYQALASNPSISLVIFGDHPKCALTTIGDNRIYRFSGTLEKGGQTTRLHYFEYIVNELLPDIDENKDKSLLDAFVLQLSEATKSKD